MPKSTWKMRTDYGEDRINEWDKKTKKKKAELQGNFKSAYSDIDINAILAKRQADNNVANKWTKNLIDQGIEHNMVVRQALIQYLGQYYSQGSPADDPMDVDVLEDANPDQTGRSFFRDLIANILLAYCYLDVKEDIHHSFNTCEAARNVGRERDEFYVIFGEDVDVAEVGMHDVGTKENTLRETVISELQGTLEALGIWLGIPGVEFPAKELGSAVDLITSHINDTHLYGKEYLNAVHEGLDTRLSEDINWANISDEQVKYLKSELDTPERAEKFVRLSCISITDLDLKTLKESETILSKVLINNADQRVFFGALYDLYLIDFIKVQALLGIYFILGSTDTDELASREPEFEEKYKKAEKKYKDAQEKKAEELVE